MRARPVTAALDPEERRPLRLIAAGRGTVAIAAELHVSERTVKRLTSALLRKLRVSSRRRRRRWPATPACSTTATDRHDMGGRMPAHAHPKRAARHTATPALGRDPSYTKSDNKGPFLA
ncbi:helix-turn-helix transcriptional regulator [Actinomycetes bacterium KLBMP 9797]